MKKAWLFLGMFILSSTILAQGQGGIPSSGRKVHNMGDPINTRGDDFCPTITADGRTMVFDSKLPDEDNHNLYISYYSDGKWSTPRFIKELNTEYNEETPYITPDGSTLVFASDRPEGMQPSVTADGMRRITFDIYISQNINGMWTAPKPVAGDVNTTRNERSPSLSHDRKTLFFSRWRFRNIEKAQIMKADLSDNAYINSRALPFPVNSDNYDIGFIPSRTRSGFYFSSRREGGHGGWDLYFAPEKNGEFKEIINMGPGINSPDNELFMAEGGSDIFFCSNRYGSLGDTTSSRQGPHRFFQNTNGMTRAHPPQLLAG
jgi:Tol biopolymer transport system component